MDKILKALRKLAAKEQKIVKKILVKLKNGNLAGLDIKKLKGHENIYRIRKGKIRIIYRAGKDNDNYLLAIERRNDNTYSF